VARAGRDRGGGIPRGLRLMVEWRQLGSGRVCICRA
jgi:hypothetical protein